MIRTKAYLLVLALVFTACGGDSDHRTIEEKYQSALEDARVAEPREISQRLISIDSANEDLIWDNQQPPRVLVATMTDWAGYYDYAGSEMEASRELWVTVVPEVQHFCLSRRSSDASLRLEQLLGLNVRGRDLIIELYADPADMFRPSADPDIGHTSTMLELPADVSPEYAAWYNELKETSYGPGGYPWTRLGYTCDWAGGGCKQGLSEFVVRSGSIVRVRAIYTVSEYCETPQ
jgi:hypothetical protein